MWLIDFLLFKKNYFADPKLSNDNVGLRSYWIVLINKK